MKNSKINSKGIASAISFVVFFIYCNITVHAQTIVTQSHCFTASAVSISGSAGCNTGECGHDGWPTVGCGTCIKVTITSNKCAGLHPNTFTVTSNASDDCHSVCSPNGDFTNDTNDPSLRCRV